MKLNIKNFLKVLFGVAIMAFSLIALLSPGNMAPGGAGAIALMLSKIVPLKVGTIMYFINIPLFMLAFKSDKKFFINSLVGATLFSLFANVFSLLPEIPLDNMLRAIFGGAALGAGFGIIFSCRASTGGSDIVAFLISRKKPHLKIATVLLFVDLSIIAVSAVFFGSVQSALYAVVALYISAKVLDSVLEGGSFCKTVFIISEKSGEISKNILEKANRGVTALSAKGMYTGQTKEVVFCTISAAEIVKIKKIIFDIDSDAFVIVCDTKEVIGKGFNNIG